MTTYEEATAAQEAVRDKVAADLRMWPVAVGVTRRGRDWLVTVKLPREPKRGLVRPRKIAGVRVFYESPGLVKRLPGKRAVVAS